MRTIERRQPLSDTLVTDLAAGIIGGRLASGTMLPPEPQLTTQFSVSRTVVREAMARLQKMGLIRIRQGSGTVVLSNDSWREFDPDLVRVRSETKQIQDLIPDLLAIRRMVEVEVAGYVALHRAEDDIADLGHLIETMHAVGPDPHRQTELDLSFHQALIAARGNHLLREMMAPINQLRVIGSLITTSSYEGIISRSVEEHGQIFNAIVAGDSDAARTAMSSHLDHFELDLASSLGKHGRFTSAK